MKRLSKRGLQVLISALFSAFLFTSLQTHPIIQHIIGYQLILHHSSFRFLICPIIFTIMSTRYASNPAFSSTQEVFDNPYPNGLPSVQQGPYTGNRVLERPPLASPTDDMDDYKYPPHVFQQMGNYQSSFVPGRYQDYPLNGLPRYYPGFSQDSSSETSQNVWPETFPSAQLQSQRSDGRTSSSAQSEGVAHEEFVQSLQRPTNFRRTSLLVQDEDKILETQDLLVYINSKEELNNLIRRVPDH